MFLIKCREHVLIRDRQHLSTVKQTAGSDMWGEGNHILTGPCEQQKFILYTETKSGK